jgi:hypothetical protein
VERTVRTDRGVFADLFHTDWASLEQLQGALDERVAAVHARRRCPVTGTTIREALVAEQALLQPLPTVHEPFDCVVARRVSRDCLVSFEGRRYSVPFALVGRTVEVRGTAEHVVIVADGAELARHARRTATRLLLTPAHFEGPSTATVRAPTPLGRRALAQLTHAPLALVHPAGLAPALPIGRPLSAYVALIDAARAEANPPSRAEVVA